jgi:cobyrinic acid a,c-diamide synthase
LAKAIVLAAPNSGSGKTLITLGLIRAFRSKGLKVVSAKLGPDYIDPQFHAAASGHTCINLDLWAMGKEGCVGLLNEHSKQADITVIEGVMGLFDGPPGANGSTADFARALGLPIILVMDASHQAQTIAAVMHGLTTFQPDLNIKGVILNRVKSPRHEAALRELARAKILGAVRHNDSLSFPSRHLGLVQAIENQGLETSISQAASIVARETELDTIFNLASEPTNQLATVRQLPPLGQRIAIARDEAFSFAYPHMLQAWREQGAELSFFSPLQNQAPAAASDAIYLPGGYPELHAAKLAANSQFLSGLRQANAMIYGECGGYMVLGDILTDASGATHRMAGLLRLETSFAQRKLHLGYRQLKPLCGPWSKPLRGHEFHYSSIIREEQTSPLFEAHDAAGNSLGNIGQRIGHVMGSYAHIIAEAPQ